MKRIKLLVLLLSFLFCLNVAFAAEKHGSKNPGVNATEQNQMLITDKADELRPVWCGRDIGLVYTFTYENMFWHDIDTGEKVIIDGGQSIPLACSPDGKWLVYISSAVRSDEGDAEKKEVVDLWRFEFETGKREKFIVVDMNDIMMIRGAVFSPDGQKFFPGRRPVESIEMPEPVWKVVWAQKDWNPSSAVWLGDSSGIISTNWNSHNKKDFLEVRLLSSGKKNITIDLEYDDYLLWATGKDKQNKFYMKVWDGQSIEARRVVRCDIDLKTEKASCETILKRDRHIFDFDVFSDGKTIVFTEDGGQCVYILRKGKEKAECLAGAEDFFVSYIKLSPDESQVAFRDEGIYLANTDSVMGPPTASGDYSHFYAGEAEKIKRFSDFVKKDWHNLYLRTKLNSYITLSYMLMCAGGDSCRAYMFRDYFKDKGFYNVLLHRGEYIASLMISDKTGKQYDVYDSVEISPGGKRFVTVSPGGPFNINGVFVWFFEGDKIVSELHYEPEEYGLYEFVEWKDDKTVLLNKLVKAREKFCPDSVEMMVPVVLRLGKDGWRFQEDFSKDAVKCINE